MKRADRNTVLRLAAEADIDPRSAAKALREGPNALRGRAGERAAEGIERLGLRQQCTRASAPPSDPPRAA